MFGKAWCITNPQSCDEIFPYLGWFFLIFGLILVYRIYKDRKRDWMEYVAATLFIILGSVVFWVTN